MNKVKENKAITLIALVVTIVILIILATISVNLVLNGGLVDRTQKGKALYENARNEEEKGLDAVVEYTSKFMAGAKVAKPEKWDSKKVEAISDGNGGVVPIPEGYYYVGGDIGTGIVISDKEGDTMDATGVEMRKSICVDTSSK